MDVMQFLMYRTIRRVHHYHSKQEPKFVAEDKYIFVSILGEISSIQVMPNKVDRYYVQNLNKRDHKYINLYVN